MKINPKPKKPKERRGNSKCAFKKHEKLIKPICLTCPIVVDDLTGRSIRKLSQVNGCRTETVHFLTLCW